MVEEILLVVNGDRVILGLIVNMLLVCNDYLDGSDFLLQFFELFAVDVEVIEIIRRKKYELLHNLKYL